MDQVDRLIKRLSRNHRYCTRTATLRGLALDTRQLSADEALGPSARSLLSGWQLE
jgi:hypothetical protein